MRKAIDEPTLTALLENQAVREFACRRAHQEGAWTLHARIGAHWVPIRSKREPQRVWRSLTAVGGFCEAMGIRTMTVEY